MKAVLLIDFGSTYTKVTAVDVEEERVLGTAQSFTTIETDINDGLNNALKILREKTGPVEFSETYACSSAAGGLRMVTSGLVPELTGEAAKLASLGAGAKVVGIYAFQLTEDDLDEIRRINPDGTGDRTVVKFFGGQGSLNVNSWMSDSRHLAFIRYAYV